VTANLIALAQVYATLLVAAAAADEGNSINLNQTAAQAAASMTCTLTVAANPLGAGPGYPWQLTGRDGTSAAAAGCTMTNAVNLGAYVQATILNPRTGALSVYNPLVVTQGTTPAVAPVVPRLPRNAIVTIDVGFNGTDLTQVGATPNALQQGRCVDGLGSVFDQVSFCNGISFFNAAFALEREGRVRVPGTGRSANMVPTAGAIGTGTACPTTRNFDMVDQDPSDNVTTKYLLNGNGQTAQNTPANATAIVGATTLVNGSDDKLLAAFLDPANGCTPFTAPDTTDPTGASGSRALNELSARVNQQSTIAVVPPNDEMTLVGGRDDHRQDDVYRLYPEPGMPSDLLCKDLARNSEVPDPAKA
jgi:hypothetical protein